MYFYLANINTSPISTTDLKTTWMLKISPCDSTSKELRSWKGSRGAIQGLKEMLINNRWIPICISDAFHSNCKRKCIWALELHINKMVGQRFSQPALDQPNGRRISLKCLLSDIFHSSIWKFAIPVFFQDHSYDLWVFFIFRNMLFLASAAFWKQTKQKYYAQLPWNVCFQNMRCKINASEKWVIH